VRILVSSSRIDDISANDIFLNLVLTNGIVSSNALTQCGGLLTGVIIIPNAPFRYQLEGYDSDGNSFSRTRDVLIEAKSEECKIPTPPTTATTSSPSPSPTSDCPCLNGGSCVTVVRFGCRRVFCRCADGYTGSICQHSKFIHYVS